MSDVKISETQSLLCTSSNKSQKEAPARTLIGSSGALSFLRENNHMANYSLREASFKEVYLLN